jgi:Recombinase zinc beta ribbon domain
MGALYKRGNVWWCKYYGNGRPIRESTGCAGEKEARERAASSFPGVTGKGRRVSRPSGADLVSPYLLSGLAVCAACGGSLVAITRPHGTGATRQRVAMYGCVYHQKRGRVVCKRRRDPAGQARRGIPRNPRPRRSTIGCWPVR